MFEFVEEQIEKSPEKFIAWNNVSTAEINLKVGTAEYEDWLQNERD